MYDVIIVGAGPAGTTAALYANVLGLKCIILDKATFPRDKICGDALSGKTVRILKELELIDGIEGLDGSDINRITFGSPSHSQFDIHLKDSQNSRHITKGYVIPRQIFDHYLFQRADQVSDTRQGFAVKDLVYDQNVIAGVKGIDSNGKEEILLLKFEISFNKSSLLAEAATCQPSFANFNARALPIPLLAPVIQIFF